MPIITNVPVTKQEGQRSLDFADAFLARITPVWTRPALVDAITWRKIVQAQPIAELFRDTLISSILSLDWKISVRDTNMQDELAATVRYYTHLLERGGYSTLDWTSHMEWVGKDLLDIPFGGASEIGRKGDSPNGRVQWIEPLDGGTLYPTLNNDFPVIQDYNAQQVAFPRHAIARVFNSPRTEIQYKGWGTAPPERVYMALQMLSRGDSYYANLLLDIPSAGILDLGDMERESALEWVEAYKGFIANGGNTSFKIPVLYEHNTDVKFIPFGKVPNDIMFDRITLRYAAYVGAAYGMSLGDIGIQVTSSGGETLAGAIRSERKTRVTGRARLKKKLKYYIEQILPPTLRFDWVDYDDELNVALARARLANATAMAQYTKGKIITPAEARKQLMTDGMFTISMPETVPDYDWEEVDGMTAKRPGILGDPVAPSAGGEGEIRKSELTATAALVVDRYFDEFSQIAEQNLDTPADAIGEMDSIILMSTFDTVSDVLVARTALLHLRDVLLETEVGIDYNDAIDVVGERLINTYNELEQNSEGENQ